MDPKNLFYNHKGDVRAAVFCNDNEIILIFRGTEYAYDWFSNLSAWPGRLMRDQDRGYVHTGFNAILSRPDKIKEKPLIDCISERIIELLNEKQRDVYVTGHSLGGALAVLFASRANDEVSCAFKGIYTFGQPGISFKYGNFVKSYKFEKLTHRVCSGIDIVTFMPPILYRQVGDQYWIHDGKIIPNAHWFTRIYRTIKTALSKIVRDHSMEKYIKTPDFWSKTDDKKADQAIFVDFESMKSVAPKLKLSSLSEAD